MFEIYEQIHCQWANYIYVIYRPRGPDREILARGHENGSRPQAESHFHDRGQVSPYPDRARPVNNVFIFLCAILNQIHTKFQCCELDLRSVVFDTLLQVWLTNSQDNMTKKHLIWF